MNIVIIGSGYVGLVTAACFAKMGHLVFCLDNNEEKISRLQKADIPIYEPGLKEIIVESMQEDRLFFSSTYPDFTNIDVAFLCVSTPQNEDGSCNTSHLFAAAKTLGQHLVNHTIIVNKSTAPVGTTHALQKIIEEAKPANSSFSITSNPEFLKQGSAVQDCMKPDRIIIGIDNLETCLQAKQTKKRLEHLYALFMMSRSRLLWMDIASCELTKYVANAMLSARISFMNEIADLAQELGADIRSIRKGIGADARIGYDFLYAGLGFGGSCFPKDLAALQYTAKQNGIKTPMLEAITSINNRQKQRVITILENHFKPSGGVKKKVIALWGLSFKPDTDDIREAPSLTIIEYLQKKGAYLQVFDPAAMNNVRKYLSQTTNITFCKNPIEAAKNADAICLVTEWKQFRSIDFAKIEKKESVLFIDGRNQYKPEYLTNKGFIYVGIGTAAKQANGTRRLSFFA